MFGILPLIFALVLVHAAGVATTPPDWFGLGPVVTLILGMTVSACLWLLVAWISARGLRRWRNYLAPVWWDNTASVLVLGLFAWWCYVLRWGDWVAWSSLVQLLPFCAVIIATWWIGARAWHQDRAWSAVAVRLKFGLLPALVTLGLFDLVQALVFEPLFETGALDFLGQWREPALLAVALGMMLVVITMMPAVVIRLWGAKPMPPGDHRSLIEEGCQRMGIRVSKILSWPAAAGRFYNAAAMGVIPPLRYVLFSEDLLAVLPPDQLRAVLGHELGHIRHHHILIYILFLIMATVIAWGLGSQLHLMLADSALGELVQSEVLYGLVVILLFAFLLRGVFGYLSRACERQADLAGAELAGGTGPMQAALVNIAQLSGQPIDAPSWRHHSIRERVAYLAAVEQDPEAPQRHHNSVRGIVIAIVLGLVVMLGLSLVSSAPFDDQGWLEEHPHAAAALNDAENGNWQALSAWIGDTDVETRRELAALITKRLNEAFEQHQEAVRAGTATKSEAEVLYGMRGILYPLVFHSFDHPDLESSVANNAAYAAVAGTAEPSEEDLQIARTALPAINRAAFAQGQYAYHDTVGCILFRLGDRQAARRHFEMAQQLIGERKDQGAFKALVERRIAACADPDASLPLEPAPTSAP